jgi:hypothetical protein
MINPNRMHRARGIVKYKHPHCPDLGGKIEVNGHDLQTYVDLSKFQIGQVVNVQAQFSICLDQYIIKTVRKVKS